MKTLFRFACIVLLIVFCTSFQYTNPPGESYYIVISKKKYELRVYDSKGWLVTFPVVFGSNDPGDKLMEGDRRTPEGTFTIISKRVHEKWDRFLMLDYPNADSYRKFNDRKARGLIPQNASIGGGVGIHGTWPHEGYAVDQYQNWTWGCISMKNQDVEELFQMIPVGTKVTIRE